MENHAPNLLVEISTGFDGLTDSPEKTSMIVLLLHDVTGLKKKDIRLMLEHGPKLSEIYSNDQDFSVNKKPEAKMKGKAKGKKKKAHKRNKKA